MRSKSWRRRALGLVFGVLASVAMAASQPPRGKPPGASPPGAPAGEVREAMEQMVIARMKVALHLTEAQEATVIPRVRRLMQARRDHAAKRRAAMARLRALLLDRAAQRCVPTLVRVAHSPAHLDAAGNMFGRDGFHPSIQGYRRWGSQIAESVLSLLKTS